MFIGSHFQGIIDPSGIASFQWSHGHYFAGEMTNHNTDAYRPYELCLSIWQKRWLS